MYQTIAIFLKGSGFLEWEPISSNSKIKLFNYFKTVSKGLNSGPWMFSLCKNYPI